MVFIAVFLFICSGFFLVKGMRENSKDDRLLALILFIVAIFMLFTGIQAINIMHSYGA